MNTIFDVSVTKGEFALSFLNTYSTVVLKTDSMTAIFDPVKVKCRDEDTIDLIIITHEHSDHFERDLVINLQKQKNALVLTTPFLAQKLEEIEEYVKPLKVEDSFKSKDISFYAEYSNHQANQPLSFVICSETVTIYHPNDSRPFPEMSVIREKYNPGLMLFTGTLLGEMPEMAEMIRPKVIVSYSDPRLQKMKIPGIEIKALNPGEVYCCSPLKKVC